MKYNTLKLVEDAEARCKRSLVSAVGRISTDGAQLIVVASTDHTSTITYRVMIDDYKRDEMINANYSTTSKACAVHTADSMLCILQSIKNYTN